MVFLEILPVYLGSIHLEFQSYSHSIYLEVNGFGGFWPSETDQLKQCPAWMYQTCMADSTWFGKDWFSMFVGCIGWVQTQKGRCKIFMGDPVARCLATLVILSSFFQLTRIDHAFVEVTLSPLKRSWIKHPQIWVTRKNLDDQDIPPKKSGSPGPSRNMLFFKFYLRIGCLESNSPIPGSLSKNGSAKAFPDRHPNAETEVWYDQTLKTYQKQTPEPPQIRYASPQCLGYDTSLPLDPQQWKWCIYSYIIYIDYI